MRKIQIFFVLLLFSAIIFSKDLLKIGAYTGYFSPRNDVLKQIYGEEDIIYGLKAGVHVWNGFYVWLSGMQYKRTSETTYTSEITTLTLNPIYISVRYTLEYRSVNPYLEIGFAHLYFKERSKFGTSESEYGTVKSEGNGFSLDAGIEFKLSSKIILDVGIKYSQVKIDFKVAENEWEEFDLGGFQAGISFLVKI